MSGSFFITIYSDLSLLVSFHLSITLSHALSRRARRTRSCCGGCPFICSPAKRQPDGRTVMQFRVYNSDRARVYITYHGICRAEYT